MATKANELSPVQRLQSKKAQTPAQTTQDVEEEPDLRKEFDILEIGSSLRRLKFGRLLPPAIVTLSADHSKVVYSSYQSKLHSRIACSGRKNKSVHVSEILEIRSGWNTDKFMKAAKKRKLTTIEESQCFSVVFRHLRRLQKTIDLVADSPEMQKCWVLVLRKLLQDIRESAHKFNEKNWLSLKFKEADVNNNHFLSFKELWELLKKLNVDISERECRNQFAISDINKQNAVSSTEPALDFEEFVLFFRQLTRRPELKMIMRQYSKDRIDLFSSEDLQKFLKDVQGVDVQLDVCKRIIEELEPEDAERAAGNLSVHGFRLLFLSPWASLPLPEQLTVFQDMTQPLSHYFIHSTHNTYLRGHQLRGDATIEGYIAALKSGARMLELDIWDGDDEPIVTHGYTLVTPIYLRSVVRAINDYAFVASPFPVILSLENHCTILFQEKMAEIFTSIFGNKIYIPDKPLKQFPSPMQLKNKILLKAKKLAAPVISSTNEKTIVLVNQADDQDEYDSDSANAILNDVSPMDVLPKPIGKAIVDSKMELKNEKSKPAVAKALSDLIGLRAVKTRDVDQALREHTWDSMTSLSEKKARAMLATSQDKFIFYTSKHLIKVYPHGRRTNSTNMDPMDYWTAGFQHVTMNAQTSGDEMDQNEGFFRLNGSCGYILKPEWMRKGNVRVTDLMERPVKMILRIQVISAHCLPRPDTDVTDDVVDPYVLVEIFGFPFDNQKHKTHVVSSNGFNPVWNTDFEIKLKVPELALLRFCVMDYDYLTSDDFVGQYTIPVQSIAPGYRHVPLQTGYRHTFDPSAALFIKVDIEYKL